MKRLIELAMNIYLASLLVGCMAIQSPLPVDTSLQGMRAVVTGQTGTFLYEKAGVDYLVMGWPQGGSYAFVLVDKAGSLFKDIRDTCATRCNWKTAAEYVRWLETNGWTLASTSSIPAAVASNIRNLAYLVSIGSRAFPTLLVVPLGAVPADPLEYLNPKVAQ